MDTVFGILPFLFLAVLYFLPSFIAIGHHNAAPIVVVNLLLGWTLVGWAVALAMAVSKKPPVQQGPPAAPGPPSGWYPDPYESPPGQLRYYDGQAWTGHVHQSDQPQAD